MSDLVTIMQGIEGQDLYFTANLSSGWNVFKRIVRENISFIELLEALKENNNRTVILQRIEEMVKLKIDDRYINPNDTALAIYILALALTDIDLAYGALSFVKSSKNLFWTRYIWQQVQDGVIQ